MLRLIKGFPEKHHRRVQREWCVATAIVLVTLALLAIYEFGAIDSDLGIVALSLGLFLLVYPLPLAILFAWKSTFTAHIGVSFERLPEESRSELPPAFVKDRPTGEFGTALARSWVDLSAFARKAGIPGLDEFDVGNVRDSSRPYYDATRGIEVVEGLLRAWSESTSGLPNDTRVIADLVHLKDKLVHRPEGTQRFSLVMLSR